VPEANVIATTHPLRTKQQGHNSQFSKENMIPAPDALQLCLFLYMDQCSMGFNTQGMILPVHHLHSL
jgi:hypothetical protein